MPAKATLYLRTRVAEGKYKYSRVTFDRKNNPEIPADYDGTFYVRVRENKKRTWVPFGQLDKALVFQTKFEGNVKLLAHGLEPLPLSEPDPGPLPTLEADPTIKDAARVFIAECEARIQDWRNGLKNGLSPATVSAYKRAALNFVASCNEFGAVRISELADPTRGAAILLHHKEWLQKNTMRREHGKGGYSDSRQFTVLGQFLAGHNIKMAKDRKLVPGDTGILKHSAVPQMGKPSKADIYCYTPEDIEAMLSACDTVGYKGNNNESIYDADDLRDLVLIMFWSGCRDEEIQHLEWTDFIPANGDGCGKLIIQDKPHYNWRVKDHEKREIRLKSRPQLRDLLVARQKRMQTAAWLERHKGHSTKLVFSTSVGTPNQNFADHIAALQERAELGEVKRRKGAPRKPYQFSRPEVRRHILHLFRKSYATWQSLLGEPSQNIQDDLGHSELSTTERYLCRVDDRQAALKGYNAIR